MIITTPWIISLTVIAVVLIQMLIGALVLVFVIMNKRAWPNRMTVRFFTGGKPLMHPNVKWRFLQTKKYGEYILAKVGHKYVPMPRFDNKWMLPSAGGRGLYLDVTAKDGYFYANDYTAIKKLSEEDKQRFFASLKDQYNISALEEIEAVINPIAHEDRSAIMQAQEKARDLIQERKPWWQHPLVAFMLPMFAGLVLGLIFAILGYQFGTNFADAVTPAAQAASSGVAERLAETVAGGPPQ